MTNHVSVWLLHSHGTARESGRAQIATRLQAPAISIALQAVEFDALRERPKFDKARLQIFKTFEFPNKQSVELLQGFHHIV